MTNEDKTAQKAAEKEQIDACRKALEPLARISTKGERLAVRPAQEGQGDPPPPAFTAQYRVNRCRRQVTITAGDIQTARKARDDPKATLDDLHKALQPLARLPVDLRIEKPGAVIYTFPGEDEPEVSITNAMIESAQAAIG